MKHATPILVAAACLGLEACSNQYWQRTDTINFAAGDAVATNSAVHIPDPWPRRSDDTNIPMDPIKAANAIELYRRTAAETITERGPNGTKTTTGSSPGIIGVKHQINVNQSNANK